MIEFQSISKNVEIGKQKSYPQNMQINKQHVFFNKNKPVGPVLMAAATCVLVLDADAMGTHGGWQAAGEAPLPGHQTAERILWQGSFMSH